MAVGIAARTAEEEYHCSTRPKSGSRPASHIRKTQFYPISLWGGRLCPAGLPTSTPAPNPSGNSLARPALPGGAQPGWLHPVDLTRWGWGSSTRLASPRTMARQRRVEAIAPPTPPHREDESAPHTPPSLSDTRPTNKFTTYLRSRPRQQSPSLPKTETKPKHEPISSALSGGNEPGSSPLTALSGRKSEPGSSLRSAPGGGKSELGSSLLTALSCGK